jgi:hypothetical protein
VSYADPNSNRVKKALFTSYETRLSTISSPFPKFEFFFFFPPHLVVVFFTRVVVNLRFLASLPPLFCDAL